MTKIHTFAECSKFSEVKEVKLSDVQAEMMVMKLAKHFKLSIRYVEFYNYRTALAYKWERKIRLWHNPDVRIICHEVCHFLCWSKFPDKQVRHGTKRWYRQLSILTNYAKKKNYWKEEFERRTAPKPVKPEPTKQELRLVVIERLEGNCNRYHTKLKLYSNKLKKAEKKINRLKLYVV